MRLKGKHILISGGHGRLGRELVPLLKSEGAVVMAPARQEWDINLRPCGLAMPSTPDIIIHAAAYTDVARAETEKYECQHVNIEGTQCVSKLAHGLKAKLVYISSDYVNVEPMGFYAFTKKAGEAFIAKRKGLIIRTSFKSRGTWGPNGLMGVFHPVYTNADWTDIIAEKIVKAICDDRRGIINIGTQRKTLRDLALQDYPDVQTVPVGEADAKVGYIYPRDTCMELTI
jgi:dTDP-4-dehydrorhamnose reductase|tara:strand:- start:2973 stop:3659 length:687 start_codon:yes stop_codon:yes gene_type:complete